MAGPFWEGLELAPAHRLWRFWIAQGRDELPEARRYSDLVPFRRGRLPRPGHANRRMLELRGYIQEATLAALLETRDTFKGLLDPEAEAPGTLVDPMEDGSVRWCRAMPVNILSSYGGEATRLMSIELQADDPYWYGAWGTLAADGGLFADDGHVADGSAALVVVPTSGAHDVDVNALGTASTERVEFRFTGPSLAGPGVEVEMADGSIVGFALGYALAAGAELVVNNDTRTALLDGVTVRNALTLGPGNRHGEYARLRPGLNTIRIFGQPAAARIQFTPTYL